MKIIQTISRYRISKTKYNHVFWKNSNSYIEECPIQAPHDKRDHVTIGSIREKEPPFSLIVQIYNQAGQMIPGTIRIKGKYDKDWVIFSGKPSAEYISHFQMERIRKNAR